MDYFSTIAETTQSRSVLRIIFNKFYEVKRLSAIVCKVMLIAIFFFRERGGGEGENLWRNWGLLKK
ncbi:MAG TPA: hypothetical protein DEG17_26455 [Cyanobacteria bacterium UBA11149]|nr:hypothetical protein [Cyanobacteria bacterium UBA11159]HBW92311.1 hypothetical protein [Cyanobacteria bacterium UBA11149]HCA94929.1 hypothetical protein [Cyanobacteria bacterium UBA9226]